ncbi:MAG: MogA/MoaB family molybdenum cofactor biosynthesis protein [Ancrocorticia sp.]|uniref:MogA/MoaB family molybdenum cofactor biosynthesis protein n=1 Tax=Ancrocorticia sp. TaxID=2593684 RepID=UPI003F8FE2D7
MDQPERPMRQMDRDISGAVIVINDHIVSGERKDSAGPLAVTILGESRVNATGPHGLLHCPEQQPAVARHLQDVIKTGARFILTVGGTGISAGDVAPEATAPLLDVRMDGIAQQVRDHGLTQTPLASLSRGLVGITHRGKGGVLIVNAPGSRGGVKDSLAVVCPLLPHIFEQLDDQD